MIEALVAVAYGSSISAMLPECRCLDQFDADADANADPDADAGALVNLMLSIAALRTCRSFHCSC